MLKKKSSKCIVRNIQKAQPQPQLGVSTLWFGPPTHPSHPMKLYVDVPSQHKYMFVGWLFGLRLFTTQFGNKGMTLNN